MTEYILGTMLAAGVLGGLINYYLSDPQAEKPLTWWQHLIVGLGAAFMVPVFLNMISSRLIADIAGAAITPDNLSRLLVLAGFCLLAAVSSRAFIRSMTDRLLREVSAAKKVANEAKVTAENAEAMVEATVEPELEHPPVSSALASAKRTPVEITDNERKVLKAMMGSRFSMRSLTGIARDAGLPPHEVQHLFGTLFEKCLIVEGKSKSGQPRWYPTAEGRLAAGDA